LKKLEKLLADPKIVAMNTLTQVTGIGPKVAFKLYQEEGVETIEDLRQEKIMNMLNHHQLVGLKYFKEFQERIPRDEIVEMEKIMKSVLPEIDERLQITICGSYRRLKPSCGDVDCLITHPDYNSDSPAPDIIKQFVEKLKEKKNF